MDLQPNESAGGKQQQVTPPTIRLPLCSWLPLPAEAESCGIDARVHRAALWVTAGLRNSHMSVTIRAAALQTLRICLLISMSRNYVHLGPFNT